MKESLSYPPHHDVKATIPDVRLWGRTHSFAPYIAPHLLGKDGLYRSDGSDTRIFDAVCDVMEKANCLDIRTSSRRIAMLAGVGFKTVLRSLERLNGWLLDVVTDKEGLHIRLAPGVLKNGSAQMTHIVSLCNVQLPVSPMRNHFDEPVADEYRPRKADDPFLFGTSRTMRAYIELIAEEAPDVQAAVAATQAAEGNAAPTPYDIAKALYTRAAFCEPGLRVLDHMIRIGTAATIVEIALATGMKVSTTERACRKLAQANLLDVEKMPNAPALFTLPADVWQRLDELSPSLRSYRLSNERKEKHWLAAQKWVVREYAAASDEEQAQALLRRFTKLAKKRMANLLILNPGRSEAEIEDQYQVYGMLSAAKFTAVDYADASLYEQYQTSPDTAETVRSVRTEHRIEHRETVKMIADLALAIADVGAPLESVFTEIMKYGVFDPAMVRAVLQSSMQMRDYETLEELRRRVRHDEIVEGMTMPPPQSTHNFQGELLR